jgi:hypothetical protein
MKPVVMMRARMSFHPSRFAGDDETLGTKMPPRALFHLGLTRAHGQGAS